MIGGDFNTPVVHQDLANSAMGPMYMPFGGVIGGYNTSYLGGVQMQRQLDHDKISLMNRKENQDSSTMKKALGALVVILGLGAIAPLRKSIKKAGGIGKYLSNQWKAIVNAFKGNKPIKNSKPATTNNGQKVNWWQKLKNVFKKSPKP